MYHRLVFYAQNGPVELSVAIANTPADRTRGLTGVRYLPDGFGMLFVWPRDVREAFTMAATPISLDLIYLDASGMILAVTTARGMDPRPYPAPTAYRAVVEVPAEWAGRYGITRGDRVAIPRDAWVSV